MEREGRWGKRRKGRRSRRRQKAQGVVNGTLFLSRFSNFYPQLDTETELSPRPGVMGEAVPGGAQLVSGALGQLPWGRGTWLTKGLTKTTFMKPQTIVATEQDPHGQISQLSNPEAEFL